MVTGDTSFLFSLYGRDAHTSRAKTLARQTGRPFAISPFNDYELANAIRLSVFQQILTQEIGRAMLADFAADRTAGIITPVSCNLAEVLLQASRLSATHTLAGGHRAFDIIHVAVALVIKAEVFLTFDKNQRVLAKAVGLETKP